MLFCNNTLQYQLLHYLLLWVTLHPLEPELFQEGYPNSPSPPPFGYPSPFFPDVRYHLQMHYQHVKVHRQGHIATLQFNRPQKANALSHAHLEEIEGAILSFREDTQTRVVIFTGSGNHFSSGADLSDELDVSKMPLVQRRRQQRAGETLHRSSFKNGSNHHCRLARSSNGRRCMHCHSLRFPRRRYRLFYALPRNRHRPKPNVEKPTANHQPSGTRSRKATGNRRGTYHRPYASCVGHIR